VRTFVIRSVSWAFWASGWPSHSGPASAASSRAERRSSYGYADDEDGEDHRRPAEDQARERKASTLFSGALDLVQGRVAKNDRRDGRQRRGRVN
jgi:hypothetical protein